MSDIFAEATVKISPSLTGFVKDLETQLKERMEKVKAPPIRIRPALTADFVGDLRKQVNAAVIQAQTKIKPIRIKAFIEPVGVASGAAGVLRGGGAGAGTGAGGAAGGTARGGGVAGGRSSLTGANQALTRSLEHVATAQLHLNSAFDESISLEKQLAAVTKVTTSLDDAQEAAEKTLTKAIVAKDATLQKAARRQLRDIEDFQKAVAPRAEQVRAAVPAAIDEAAIAKTRKAADATKDVVARLNAADIAAAKLGKTTGDLAARQELLKTQTLLAADATKAESKALATDNTLVQKAAINAKARAVFAVDSAKKEIAAIQEVQKAEAAAAKQSEKLAQQQAATRRRQQQAAAREASATRRRSEQLSRGGQASILSLAGIRGATLAASRSFLVGAAAITVFANAVRQFADLERNLHVFEATTSATHEEMEAVREEARLLGADLTLPAVTAEEAAGAMVELAKAGLTVVDSMNAARAVLELATAAAISNADATRLVANVLNAFSLAGTDATAVADTLANAANAAQGSIADIGTAFQQAASAGRQVGLSFQDTATFLTILAKNGIRGSDAGTSLRTALIRLINPSKNAKAQFRELGIEIHDAVGNLRPDVFLQIAAATREMAPAQRDATIALIGGQDAFRAVTILGRQSVEEFIAMRKALREQGTAAELAAARTKGLHGSIDALQSVMETIGTTMASHVGPGLAGFVYSLGRGVTALSESTAVADTFSGSLEAVSTSLNLVGDAIQAVSVVALPLAGLLLDVTNAVSPTALLGGFVAFKTLNAILDGSILRLKILKPLLAVVATAKTTATILSGIGGANLAKVGDQMVLPFTQAEKAALNLGPRITSVRVALRALGQTALIAATSTTALTLGLGAAAAAITYLMTRETALERATRKLKDATEELTTARERLNQAEDAAQSIPLEENSSRLAVLRAKEARDAARTNLQTSNAAEGTFARTKLELELAVAIDNVSIAQQNLTSTLERTHAANLEAVQARENERKAAEEQVVALQNLAKEQARQAVFVADTAQVEPDKVAALAQAVAARTFTQELIKQAQAAREAGDAESILNAQRLEMLAQVSTLLNQVPSEHAIEIAVEAESIDAALEGIIQDFGLAGTESARVLVAAVRGELNKQLKNAFTGLIKASKALVTGLGGTGAEAGREFGHRLITNSIDIMKLRASELARTMGVVMRRALQELGRLEEQALDITIAGGSDAQRLSNLQAQRIEQQKIVRAQQARVDAGFSGATGSVRKAKEELARIIEEIRSIQDSMASDAESAAKEAEDKQNEIFENLLEAMGVRRDRQQERIEDASLTESLADDIRQTQILRKIAKQQIENLKERIARAKAQGKNVDVLIEGLEDLKKKWRDLGRTIVDLNREQAEQRRDILFERFELRIQIAQSREDVAAELRARRAKLEALTAELVRIRRAFGKNSIEWLRAKAAQVEEIAAIKELEESTKEKNNALDKLFFEFLQAQQGFANKLLGNLIPIDIAGALTATAPGTTAGVTDPTRRGPETGPGSGLPPGSKIPASLATASAAGSDLSGPTRGQASIEIDVLRKILATLERMEKGERAPQAKNAKKLGSTVMDMQ